MAYTPENNPFIPGDPYSYDLKWVVDQIKGWKDPLDSAAEAKASEEAAKASEDAAKDSEIKAKQSEEAAKDYADNIADPVSGIVTDWLDDHITQPTTPAIDDTLTVQGAAADSKAAGDAIAERYLRPALEVQPAYTITQGVMGFNGTVYNPSDSYTGRYTSLAVSPGEQYKISCFSLNSNYPGCIAVKSDNTKSRLLTGTNVAFSNELVTIPADVTLIYVNGTTSNPIQIIKIDGRMTDDDVTELLMGDHKPICALLQGGTLAFKWKFNSTHDVKITLGHKGPNNLLDFTGIGLVANTDPEVNTSFTNDFSLPGWSMAATDIIGPYRVRAVNNGNGDHPTLTYFTGGMHGDDNTQNGAATASQISLVAYADGVPLADGVPTKCYSIKVKWKNAVQAYNTTKTDGSGRAVLTETWKMDVDLSGIHLENDIEALEDIVIDRYFGLQMYAPGKKFYYKGGVPRAEQSVGTSGNSGNKTCRSADVFGDSYYLTMNMDTTDLGAFDYTNISITATTANKIYFNTVTQDINATGGDHYFIKGSYILNRN